MADVFISYASEDRETIRPLIEHILSAGFSVWWDRQIGVGANFDREIERELAAAKCVVVVWSPNSIESEWVYNEAQEGHDRGVLIPVSLNGAKPPLAFRRVQTEALQPNCLERSFDLVTLAISETLGPERVAEQLVSRSQSDSEKRLPRFWLPIAASGLLLVILIWYLLEPGLTRPALDLSIAVDDLSVIGSDPTLVDRAQALGEGVRDTVGDYQEMVLLTGPEASPSYRITGNLQAVGESVRVQIRLERHGERVWAESFDQAAEADPRDLFVPISRLSRLESIKDYQCVVARSKTEIAAAGDAVCLALDENYRMNRSGNFDPDTLARHAEHALELDPLIPEAWWNLAIAEQVKGNFGWVPWQKAAPAAHLAVDRALALEPENPLFLWTRGSIALLELDYQTAEDSISRALAINHLHPNARWFHAELGYLEVMRGNLNNAVAHFERAVKAFDSDARVYGWFARVLNLAGRSREALTQTELGLQLTSQGTFHNMLLQEKIEALISLGEPAEAAKTLDLLPPGWRSVEALILLGRAEEAQMRLAELERAANPPSWVMVPAYVAVGNLDKAFHWLDIAIDQRTPLGIYGVPVRVDSRLKPLHSDPRWDAALAKLSAMETEGRAGER